MNCITIHIFNFEFCVYLEGKTGGIVRLINRKTAERALVKGFRGKVTDISFAHLSSVILGAVDEVGNMFIQEIQETEDGKLEYPLPLNK